MLFSMTLTDQKTYLLTAQKTYLPLTVGTDTIGFFEGNAFDPYKKKYLFKSTQADKFVESHPDLDFEWSTNEQTYELKLKWNPSVIFSPAYSQDYVEYNDFTFTQNGEEISIEQVEQLTRRHRVGGVFLLSAQKKIRLSENKWKRYPTFVASALGAPAFAATTPITAIGAWIAGNDAPGVAAFFIAATGVVAVQSVMMAKLAFDTSSKNRCLIRADKQFNKVADKLNEAIQSSNQ